MRILAECLDFEVAFAWASEQLADSVGSVARARVLLAQHHAGVFAQALPSFLPGVLEALRRLKPLLAKIAVVCDEVRAGRPEPVALLSMRPPLVSKEV